MQLDVVTLFPEWFEWFASQRHVANALAAGSSLGVRLYRDSSRARVKLSLGCVSTADLQPFRVTIQRWDEHRPTLAPGADVL